MVGCVYLYGQFAELYNFNSTRNWENKIKCIHERTTNYEPIIEVNNNVRYIVRVLISWSTDDGIVGLQIIIQIIMIIF